jgi:hypothetical protein
MKNSSFLHPVRPSLRGMIQHHLTATFICYYAVQTLLHPQQTQQQQQQQQ